MRASVVVSGTTASVRLGSLTVCCESLSHLSLRDRDVMADRGSHFSPPFALHLDSLPSDCQTSN